MKRIAFIIPYPLGQAPSQRFRFEHYLAHLAEADFAHESFPFFDEQTWAILYRKGNTIRKIWCVLWSALKRFGLLFRMWRYDYIFIHREAMPIGPPIIEFVLAKILRKKIIYDFDDAIWMTDTATRQQGSSRSLLSRLRWNQKVGTICRWAYKVTVGNAYLGNYARQYNSNTILIPTVVDTEEQHNQVQKHQNKRVHIGWTGSHTTLCHLELVAEALRELEQAYDFTFFLIANEAPDLQLRSMQFIRWNKATEIQDLMRFHIGLMPLIDDEWVKGKCGFKAIQYMALGIPTVVSPVGVSPQIVEDGIHGFHCEDIASWKAQLQQLLEDADLRTRIGKQARIHVESHYSVRATLGQFLGLFSFGKETCSNLQKQD